MLQYFALAVLSFVAIGSAVSPSNGFFRILNFENRSMDLHIVNPADFDPISAIGSAPGQVAQKWFLSSTGVLNQFRISNAQTGTFASYTTAFLENDPNHAQLCAHPNSTLWNITASGAGFKIAEATFGLAITAWDFQPPFPTSPLTLETFDSSQARQVFTFQACDRLIARFNTKPSDSYFRTK
ncbi:hypothetical protein B0H15DRAFT_971992 [Mycena belliarum]|uniref:Ricin B lectin domain-containing protein n=1 Tax=Mycena belliarum TaxID=1033014 RepID=A0AAD6U7C3_9AGAR|nr:hypothetical protein B0H15DRAFT_971992 [Mycena belliae]